jgi:hypothetical protein
MVRASSPLREPMEVENRRCPDCKRPLVKEGQYLRCRTCDEVYKECTVCDTLQPATTFQTNWQFCEHTFCAKCAFEAVKVCPLKTCAVRLSLKCVDSIERLKNDLETLDTGGASLLCKRCYKHIPLTSTEHNIVICKKCEGVSCLKHRRLLKECCCTCFLCKTEGVAAKVFGELQLCQACEVRLCISCWKNVDECKCRCIVCQCRTELVKDKVCRRCRNSCRGCYTKLSFPYLLTTLKCGHALCGLCVVMGLEKRSLLGPKPKKLLCIICDYKAEDN